MFAAPSSTTAIINHSSSPSSTSSPISTDLVNTKIPTNGGSEGDQGFTILVPANVRFCGVNMHLDLKIDQETLAAASDISKPPEKVTSAFYPISSTTINSSNSTVTNTSTTNNCHHFNFPSASSKTQLSVSITGGSVPTVTTIQSPSNFKAFSPIIMDATVGEGISSVEDSKLQSVSSTTTEQNGQSCSTGDTGFCEDSQSSSIDVMPVTSSIISNLDDSTADTTVTTSAGSIEASSSTKMDIENFCNIEDNDNQEFCDTVLNNENENPVREDHLPSECVSSSSMNMNSEKNINKLMYQSFKSGENSLSFTIDTLPNDAFHDSQPCSSTNVQPQISSTNNSYAMTANEVASANLLKTKKRRIGTPNYCGYIDQEKGQCKQRAILSFKYCIRHILLDPTAPYRQCQHRRKPKNKKEDYVLCTNAIRNDRSEIFCSTHLIMKGMMKPKKKGGVSIVELDKSPSVNEEMTTSEISKEDYEDSIKNSKSFNYVDNNSYESNQPLSYVDSVGNSRTGCESTGSWDQASAVSDSITPNRSYHSLQTNSIVTTQTPSPMHAVQPGVVYQQYPTLGNQQQRQVVTQNSIESERLSRQYSTNSSYYCTDQQYGTSYVRTAPTLQQNYSHNVSSPNNFNGNSVLNYTPQQQIRHQQQQYITNMRQSPAINSPHTPLNTNDNGNGNYYDTKCNNNLETNYHQQVFLSPAQQNLENRQQSISRLSKQHPQLAAKLLQPSPNTQTISVVNNSGNLQQSLLPTDINDSGNCNVIGNLSKVGNQTSSQELNQQQINLLPQNKRARKSRDYTTSGSNTTVNSGHLISQNNQQTQHVTVINNNFSNRSYIAEPSNQHQSYIVSVPPQSSHPTNDPNLINQNPRGNATYVRQQIVTAYPPYSGLSYQPVEQQPIISTRYYSGNSKIIQTPVIVGSNGVASNNNVQILHEECLTPSSSAMPSSQIVLNSNGVIIPTSNTQQLSQASQQHMNYTQKQTNMIETIASQYPDIVSFIDAEPLPVKYKLSAMEDNDSLDEEMKIRRDYLNVDSSMIRKSQKSIKLRQKRKKIRITGAFRNIPLVDSMCKVIEFHDFDSTDLFPLGLEPSDDESSSEDSFPLFGSDFLLDSVDRSLPNTMSRIELYLLKKKLRLESSRLVQGAKVSLPIIQASKLFENCVGASLRTRQMNRRRESIIGVEKARLRLCQYRQESEEKNKKNLTKICKNNCLPMSNFCVNHILFNSEQKLFTHCIKTCCRKPVLCTDAILFNRLCRQHFDENNLSSVDSKFKAGTSLALQNNSNTSFIFNNRQQPSLYSNTNDGSSKAVNQSSYNYSSYYQDQQSNQQSGLSNSNCFYNDHSNEQLNDDVVEGDVSLASVAKDLGFDGRELTDMLERLPVEDTLDDNDIVDDGNGCFLDSIKSDEDVPGIALGHSWADVEQFLLSEGYHGDNPTLIASNQGISSQSLQSSKADNRFCGSINNNGVIGSDAGY